MTATTPACAHGDVVTVLATGPASVQWGDVAAWVGALGTIAAFGLAFYLALSQRRESQHEAECAQASLVSAWLDTADLLGTPVVRLLVRNSSQSHVSDFIGTIQDTATSNTQAAEVWFPGVPPTGEPIIEILDVEFPSSAERYRYELTHEFTDVQGRRWRHATGVGLRLVSKQVNRDELIRRQREYEQRQGGSTGSGGGTDR